MAAKPTKLSYYQKQKLKKQQTNKTEPVIGEPLINPIEAAVSDGSRQIPLEVFQMMVQVRAAAIDAAVKILQHRKDTSDVFAFAEQIEGWLTRSE